MGGIIVLVALAFAVGLLMEVYKKKVRKDRWKDWEIRLVAYLLSIGGGFLSWKVIDVDAVLPGLCSTPWLILLFSVFIYLLQLDSCMGFWKPLLKRWMERRLDG
jgi:small-conductance mechanosensitive channel